MGEHTESWFEEKLVVDDATLANIEKSLASTPIAKTITDTQRLVRGIVRVDRPRWRKLSPDGHQFLTAGTAADYYLVRLGFQFDFPPEAEVYNPRFVFARCEAAIWPEHDTQPAPVIYDLYPQNLTDGNKPMQVSLKFAPKITVAPTIEVAGPEAGVAWEQGIVEPSCTGFPGEHEQRPYWTLRPKSKSLIGLRHFWMVIEAPQTCTGIRLKVQARADIESKLFGLISMKPSEPEWASRRSIVIS
ncbi:MAG: hypothetical protein H6673_05805 [Anaerolineales bacterium]|nr:hypothetical protein [Anaerolineales bacterium]